MIAKGITIGTRILTDAVLLAIPVKTKVRNPRNKRIEKG